MLDCSHRQDLSFRNTQSVVVGIAAVFTLLTDQASTIPSNNIRDSGTWSAGQKKIRGTSTKLQGEQKYTTKNKIKRQKERNNKYTCQKKIEEEHSIERVRYSASREPSDTLPGSQPCTRTHSIYHTLYSQGFSFSLTAQSTTLRESLWLVQSTLLESVSSLLQSPQVQPQPCPPLTLLSSSRCCLDALSSSFTRTTRP